MDAIRLKLLTSEVFTMTPQVKGRIVDCRYLGPAVISRDVLMGQICWHPANLKDGRPHLFSKCCEEWGGDCPAVRERSKVKA